MTGTLKDISEVILSVGAVRGGGGKPRHLLIDREAVAVKQRENFGKIPVRS